MGHFLLSLVLVTNAVVLHVRAGEPDGDRARARRRAAACAGSSWPSRPRSPSPSSPARSSPAPGPHGGDEEAPRFGFDIETVARIHSLAVLVFLGLLLVVRRPAATARARRRRSCCGPAGCSALSVAQAASAGCSTSPTCPSCSSGVHILGATLVWAGAVPPASSPAAPGRSPPAVEPLGTGALVGQD